MPVFSVTYSVTRTETYRIAATDRESAAELAFSDGELQEDLGETSNVETISIEPPK